jgi:hypothetical protein
MTRERIEDMREVVLPFVKKRLLETNYEGLGEADAKEFEREFNEILNLATKALEQEPQTFKWCTDCREYDQEKHCCHRWSKVIRDTVEETKQEPKTGQWIVHPIYAHLVCSKCLSGAPYDCKTNYCPNCGADMREVEE